MTKTEPKLRRYRQKRDPARTNEPFSGALGEGDSAPEGNPAESASAPATRRGVFVVHLHDARRRHYDLRLEVGGALVSFAVPKGPSLDPGQKRLAVQTEEHPIEYLDFEAVIPSGNYGAGAMIAWDLGRVSYLETSAEEGIARGDFKFELDGFKLRGKFALVRTKAEGKQPNWLLLKKADAFARPASDVILERPKSVFSGLTVEELAHAPQLAAGLEQTVCDRGVLARRSAVALAKPMFARAGDVPLDDPARIYELKLDGVRAIGARDGDDVAIRYRSGRGATALFPEVARALRSLALPRFVLDGEIVTYDERGRPSFERLARRFARSAPANLRLAICDTPVVYVVFDLLALGDRDLRKLPLLERKELLARVVPGVGVLRVLDHLEGDGGPLATLVREHSLEGIVAKRATSPYRSGERSDDWVKVKSEREEDFVIVGYTRGEGHRDRLGAIDVASYDAAGRLVSRGKVGSGLDEATIDVLSARLAGATLERSPAEGRMQPARRGRVFVRPEVVVRVRFLGFTEDGLMRAPVFRGIRDDVTPAECTVGPSASIEDAIERAETDDAEGDDVEGGPALDRKASPGAGRSAGASAVGASAVGTSAEAHESVGGASESQRTTSAAGRVKVTNRTKTFFPESGLTKGDLVDYYDAVAPAMLPHLRDRPVVLVRHPDGIHGKSFFQWNAPRGTPSWVRRVFVRRSSTDEAKLVEAFVVDDRDTLLYLANLGAIDIHVLAARAATLDRADFLTIDFDLGESELRNAVVLARELRTVLDQIGLASFPKTSGKTGLHVLVPVGPDATFDVARGLADLLGHVLTTRHPDIATMERLKKKRGARVLIDTGQTGPTRTIVAPYSARAAVAATVSTPLTWDEVGFALDPRRYDQRSVPLRVREIGDPMAPLLDVAADVRGAVERLGAMLDVASPRS